MTVILGLDPGSATGCAIYRAGVLATVCKGELLHFHAL